jgi:hypothetical protein
MEVGTVDVIAQLGWAQWLRVVKALQAFKHVRPPPRSLGMRMNLRGIYDEDMDISPEALAMLGHSTSKPSRT